MGLASERGMEHVVLMCRKDYTTAQKYDISA